MSGRGSRCKGILRRRCAASNSSTASTFSYGARGEFPTPFGQGCTLKIGIGNVIGNAPRVATWLEKVPCTPFLASLSLSASTWALSRWLRAFGSAAAIRTRLSREGQKNRHCSLNGSVPFGGREAAVCEIQADRAKSRTRGQRFPIFEEFRPILTDQKRSERFNSF